MPPKRKLATEHQAHADLTDLLHPVDELELYDHNPRRGSLDTIAESLKVNGQYRPVVANRRTNQVLAGNHTLQAARLLGWTHIAATWVDVDEEQAARIVLIDNRANDLAGYDETELAEVLGSLPDLAGTGYQLEDLEELLANTGVEEGDGLTDPDAVPETPKAAPLTAVGDVWLLGPHRLAVGDATDPDVVAQATDGAQADLLLTDPPYNVNYTGGTEEKLQIENDHQDAESFGAFLRELFAASRDQVKEGGPAYIFHADTEGVAFRQAFIDAGWELKQVLVWIKNRLVLGRQDHHWQHEPILYGWRPGAAHAWYGGRTLTTLLDDAVDPGSLSKDELVTWMRGLLEETTAIRADRPSRNTDHPTMKPVALLADLIARSTRRGELILDPCAGSGSAAIAAHATRRKAALVELDPRYADVICRRYQEHTGILPVREASGEAVDFAAQAAA